jgi:hypothetical protein
MSNLDPRIEAVRVKYDLARDDFWQIPQNKQWVCKHSALEIVAVKAGVWWTDMQVIEADTANGIAVISVKGTLGERVEWATGEASPKNNKNSYPWAMAEKRAKDRVVLKLVGIHGLVYSEDEAEDFKERAAPQATTPPPVLEHGPGGYDEMVADLKKCRHPDDVTRWWDDQEVIAYCNSIPTAWAMKLKAEVVAHRKHLMSKDPVQGPS